MRRCPHRHFSSTFRNSRRNFPVVKNRLSRKENFVWRRGGRKKMDKLYKKYGIVMLAIRRWTDRVSVNGWSMHIKPKWKRFIFATLHLLTSPKHIVSSSVATRCVCFCCVSVGDKIINQQQIEHNHRNEHISPVVCVDTPTVQQLFRIFASISRKKIAMFFLFPIVYR